MVDCGVRHGFAPRPGLQVRKVASGTQDMLERPAMDRSQCLQAIAHGADVVRELPGNALLIGEMGIGNSSAAALLLARLGGWPIADCTGQGTGVTGQALAHKTALLSQALQRHAAATEPIEVLAALGGLEIATLVGTVLQAAHERRVVVVDGFIASSAVLVATRLAPAVLERCVFAHCSEERGHALMLRTLQAEPLLHLGLRLGEGSGAALAWPLLVSACALLREMASFESAGVSREVSP